MLTMQFIYAMVCLFSNTRIIMTIEISTNNHWNSFINGYELTEKEQNKISFMPDESFIRYKGTIYRLNDFMEIKNIQDFKGWHAYHANGFSSGILIKLSSDGEQYQIATYFS